MELSTSFIFVETAQQATWLAGQSSEYDLCRWTLVAANPEVLYACQRLGLKYSKFEDFVAIGSRRAEYSEALEQFLTWRTWLDDWARHRIPEFGRTAFKPAESASFILSRIHAEIWATGRSLDEFFKSTRPEIVALWYPIINGVPLHLQPKITPLVMLAADAARQRGVLVHDLATESSHLAPAADAPPTQEGLRARIRRYLLEGRLRGGAAALRSGGLRDALRALLPMSKHTKRVLACGFGYDLQRLVMELRRANVEVDQISDVLHGHEEMSVEAFRDLEEATGDLLREGRFWQLVERCGVGRTLLWEAPLKRWWTGLVPRHWSAYLAAENQFRRRKYDALVLSNVGNAGSGGAISSAASAAGVRTYLYQHGGSADRDSRSLNVYVTAPDTLLVYGEGTAADLAETKPPYIDRFSAVKAVGSATLDEIRRKGQTERHHRLRKTLRGGDPRPLVLYVPTHFGGYGRSIGHDLAGYPAASYFELIERVLALWKSADGVRLVYKDFIVANDTTRVVPQFIQDEIPGAIVTVVPVRDLMWAVDAIVVDHVTTAALEVLLTDKPCVFYMPSATPQATRARGLLSKAAVVENTPDRFIEAVGQLLANQPFRRVENRNREFLVAYGTHLDDRASARRAADAVIRGNGQPQAYDVRTAIK